MKITDILGIFCLLLAITLMVLLFCFPNVLYSLFKITKVSEEISDEAWLNAIRANFSAYELHNEEMIPL